MAIFLSSLFVIVSLLFQSTAFGSNFGSRLCKKNLSLFTCYTIKHGDKWQALFKNTDLQDLVMRINRMGIQLRPGMTIAIPKNLSASALDFSPFPKLISPPGEKLIMVSLSQLAWGAYDQNGSQVRWGPISGGRDYCADVGRGCRTAVGKFMIYRKGNAGCVSTKFPLRKGGAPMPYCMFFRGGFALHGSPEVPGYNASHGCVRMFVNDAKWLNQEFLGDAVNVPVVVSR